MYSLLVVFTVGFFFFLLLTFNVFYIVFTGSGVDTMKNYEKVLRQIRYRNWDTSSFSDRKFRIKCSELNGRYTSNEFNLEVSSIKKQLTIIFILENKRHRQFDWIDWIH